jgi:hypothetical protein
MMQEVNPTLGADEIAVAQTVAVGCSLVRSAMGAHAAACAAKRANAPTGETLL